ncbi:MAG: CapA family protein, partial [Bryobacteraceae bacterium]
MLTRRALLPLLGCLPFARKAAESPAPQPVRTRLLLGGDVMLSRHVGQLARIKRDPASPFRALAPVLQSADLAFVNLEAPFSDRGPVVEQGMIFKAEPDMIAGLELAGIDIVSTANNHARDCGCYGVEFTLDWLARHKIAVVGTAKSSDEVHAGAVLERNGLRFGFLGYTYDQSNGNHTDIDDRVAVMDVERMRRDVKSLTGRADVIVVSMHAGQEYAPKPSSRQVEFAHAAINAGARVVVGHHPHVTQPWE